MKIGFYSDYIRIIRNYLNSSGYSFSLKIIPENVCFNLGKLYYKEKGVKNESR